METITYTDDWREGTQLDPKNRMRDVVVEGLFAVQQEEARKNGKKIPTGKSAPSVHIEATAETLYASTQDYSDGYNEDGTPLFPIEGFPKELKDFIQQIAEVYGVPIDFPAMSIICAVAAAIRKRIFSRDKYTNFPQLWCMIVAPSGVGKSEPLKIAFAPIEERDKLLSDIYERDMRDYLARVNSETNKKAKAEVAAQNAPQYKQFLVMDTTPEALFLAIKRNDGVTIARDELAGWFCDFNRYSKSGEIQNYLSIFNNSQFQIARKGDGNMLVYKPYLSVVGTIQPKALTDALKEGFKSGNGIWQRFIYVYPSKVKRIDPNNKEVSPALINYYYTFIKNAFEIGKNEPIEIKYTPEAKQIVLEYNRELTALTNSTDDDDLRSLYSKMSIHLCRILLVLWYVHYGCKSSERRKIDEIVARQGVAMCRYFVATGEKVYDLMRGKPTKSDMSVKDLILALNAKHPIVNQSKFAECIGLSQPLISKILRAQ